MKETIKLRQEKIVLEQELNQFVQNGMLLEKEIEAVKSRVSEIRGKLFMLDRFLQEKIEEEKIKLDLEQKKDPQ